MQLSGQTQPTQSFFQPADTLSQKRVNLALIGGGTFYTTFSIGLYNAWYRQFPQSSFHLFNDWGEWSNMDKYGHVYSTYFQAVLAYKTSRWTGTSEKRSILAGALCAGLAQTTIEMMDGFSTKWGFSITDMVANGVGIGSFALQQTHWGEQRILFKVSSTAQSYTDAPILSDDGLAQSSIRARAQQLYGTGFLESYLKDYNGQVIWASANVSSFLPEDTQFPKWLNVAVGYGAQNMLGGFENSWIHDGASFTVAPEDYPRFRQYYLAADIDFDRIKVRSPFLKTLFSVFNVFKVPSPAIEYSSQGEFRFHLMLL